MRATTAREVMVVFMVFGKDGRPAWSDWMGRDFVEELFERISVARPLKSQGLFLSFCSAADRLG